MKNQGTFRLLRNGGAIAENQIPITQDTALFVDSIGAKLQEGYRLIAYFGRKVSEGLKLYGILGDDKQGRLWIGAAKGANSFPSLTPQHPQAHLFEREIYEQFGSEPVGHPWLKPVRFPESSSVSEPIPRRQPFFQIQGEEIHEVGVGPVHAGIIEPGHFRFQCHGENVFHLEIQLGYQHRGVEKLLETAAPWRVPLIAESIAGDTAVGHAIASAMAWEGLAGSRVPPRAEALRAIALELERLANHVGDLGALAGDVGFVPAAAFFGRMRGDFLNLLTDLTGNRFGRSHVRPGGVAFDLPQAMSESFSARLRRLQQDLANVAELFFGAPSVFERMDGIGSVSLKTCQAMGLVGPAARACGQDRDVRKDYPHGIYRFHHVPAVTAEEGDVYARALVRRIEMERSMEFLLSLIEHMPSGETRSPCGPPARDSLSATLVEGWRGEIVHVITTDGEGKIARYKVKDPSFSNWTAVALSLRDQQISDFPLINKSFNLSYAGHDL
ncbi:MAG TPA: NADH-quinone oxidoreductase subunit C [bacterium]|nr:NADH-quinone oxidoreductase subunit C [bacterium]